MLLDMSSVETLYNMAVDLVGLNSLQVQVLLEHYSPVVTDRASPLEQSRTDEASQPTFIPKHWIEFVTSGVKLVGVAVVVVFSGTGLSVMVDRLIIL